jgi:mannitol/fructose-specific phosphotransferase system IIA component (Ntr-type)
MIEKLLREDMVILDLKAKDKEGVLREMISLLNLPKDKEELLLSSLMQREKLGSTGIGKGIAIPHCRSVVVDNITLIVGVSKEGVDFDALDGKPVHLLFMLVATPMDPSMQYLTALGNIARIARGLANEESIRTDFSSPKELIDYLLKFANE